MESHHASNPSGSPSGVAPWRQTPRFLGREAELEQLKAFKDKVIGAHQKCAPPSEEPLNEEGKATPSPLKPKPSPTKILDVYPAMLIWGASGTGKSALADHFLETCCICNTDIDQKQQQQHSNDQAATATACSCCYVLRGKYDEYTGQSDPFSAIVQAIQDFTGQLQRGSKEELDRIRECVRVTFPTGGLRPLVNVAPSLSVLSPTALRGDDSVMSHSASHRSDDCSASLNSSQAQRNDGSSLPASSAVLTEKTWNQLKYIFAQFIKAVSTKERPIYMFLDDLQWSANVGLDLIAHMVADPGLKHFLLLGAIRQTTNAHDDQPPELAPDHPLSRCLAKPLSPDEDDDDYHDTAAGGDADEGSIRSASTARSQAKKRRHLRSLHQITINNLTLAEMTAWLSIMLDCGDIGILSEKLHAKTDGNIYFALQALEELERKQILGFSPISQQWKWNLLNTESDESSNASSAQLPISDNIIGIIESKLRDLPMQLQQVLSIAAYIRSVFDISVLHRVLRNECKHVDGAINTMDGISTTQELSVILEQAVLQRLISNPIGGTKYHFAHDRIQQAAHGMILAGEGCDKLRLRIGRCLLKMHRCMQLHLQQEGENDGADPSSTHHCNEKSRAYTRDKTTMSFQSADSSSSSEMFSSPSSIAGVDDGLLFVAADHLNSVQTKDHMFSVTMNLEVGEKALEMAALEAAVGYLRKAHSALQLVKIVPPPKTSLKTTRSAGSQTAASSSLWDSDEHYDVCLQVYSKRADVELSLGNYEVGYKLCDEVLETARSLEDKMPTYFSMARALARENRHAETLAVEMRLLRSLKVFPKRWYVLHIAKAMMKIRRFLKNNTNEEILARPWMTDPKKTFAMKICSDMSICTKAVSDLLLVVLNLCVMLTKTIKYGICAESANALITYSLVVGGMGDQAMAERCMDLGHHILERLDAKTLQGHFRFIAGTYVIPYTLPYPEVLRQHRKGYLDSMEVGEFDIGILNYQGAIQMGYFYGMELGPLAKANNKVLDMLESYKINAFRGMADNFQFLFASFMGEEQIDWAEIETLSRRNVSTENLDPSECLHNCILFSTRAYLSLYHRRYRIANRLMANFLVVCSGEPALQVKMGEAFLMGLTNAQKYRDTGNRRYLAAMRKLIKNAHQLLKARGRVWIHLLFILEAEELAISTKNKRDPKIKHAYNLAILASIKNGRLHHGALANELAGEHFLEHGFKDMVGDYFLHAVDYYMAWGGKSKVDDLVQRHKKYLKTLNDPNRKRPEGLTNDGNGNYLFGITRDAFTGAIITRCAELDAFADRSKLSAGDGSLNVLVHGLGMGDGVDDPADVDGDDVSVLTGMM